MLLGHGVGPEGPNSEEILSDPGLSQDALKEVRKLSQDLKPQGREREPQPSA